MTRPKPNAHSVVDCVSLRSVAVTSVSALELGIRKGARLFLCAPTGTAAARFAAPQFQGSTVIRCERLAYMRKAAGERRPTAADYAAPPRQTAEREPSIIAGTQPETAGDGNSTGGTDPTSKDWPSKTREN